MLRACIYARFSTDKQREASLDDQIRICRIRAEREGWSVVAVYSDQAVSGKSNISSRQGGASVLMDAMAGRFDVLLIEGLDRFSRDSVDQLQTIRRLEHRGIRIVGATDGYDSKMQGSHLVQHVHALKNELVLADIRRQVHRGLDALVSENLFAGGLAYGYRSVQVGDDPDDGHRLEINEKEAPWVRFIFERFASGMSCQKIVFELNTMRVPSPRGGTWAVSALYGSPKKGTGILNNSLYVGTYIWNRSTWVKDPDTKKRQRFERPESEWRRRDMPELRLVPDEHWNAARARLNRRRSGGKPPKTLFSGLLRCGVCGGAVVAVSQYDYGCAARKDRGPSVCAGVRASRKLTEENVIERVRSFLLSPAIERHLKRMARESLKRQKSDNRDNADNRDKRVSDLEKEISRIVDAMAKHGHSEALGKRLAESESELSSLKGARQSAPRIAPDIVPRLLERYRAKVVNLSAVTVKNMDETREGLREIVEQIRLINDGGLTYAELGGIFKGVLTALASGHDSNVGSGGALFNKNRVLVSRPPLKEHKKR